MSLILLHHARGLDLPRLDEKAVKPGNRAVKLAAYEKED